ncbi:hypothetical protein JZO82_01465 [Vagococcus fluvialis]|uniref:hypothetical protein n=1 Tax=Vagococcus fluvialis TaxID=2738 RepID=UPI001A8F3586|nr:hypothetical protein [Vagococcus fluvialis]MBO0427818.1 hypothetical protein [Vagococcus fluvialis]
MSINKKIMEQITKLINIELLIGVQPSELVDNIFFTNYKNINLSKTKKNIIMEIIYVEKHLDTELDVSLNYFYDLNKNVVLISEKIGEEETILWSRKEKEKEILFSINSLLENLDVIERNQIIETFPKKYKNKLTKKFIIAA